MRGNHIMKLLKSLNAQRDWFLTMLILKVKQKLLTDKPKIDLLEGKNTKY